MIHGVIAMTYSEMQTLLSQGKVTIIPIPEKYYTDEFDKEIREWLLELYSPHAGSMWCFTEMKTGQYAACFTDEQAALAFSMTWS